MITRTGRRTVQGFNVQVVANTNQIVLAAEVTQSINDGDQLKPMVECAISELARAGIEEPISTVLADGGYWNTTQIASTRARQIDVLVPAKNRQRPQPRKNAPPQSDEAHRMEAILDTPEGQARYRRRQQIVEPVFANIKCLRRIDRFQRRGLRACQAEWKLIAATHNLLKLWRATRIPAAA
jgi:Transposase DDE domain